MNSPPLQLLMLGLMLVAGCTPRYSEPVLSADHPANPTAAEAAASPHSSTLDLAAAEPITPQQPPPAMQHMGHGADDAMESTSDKHDANHTPDSAASPSQNAALYVCPMHPDVTSDKPNQRCPKCGMKLKKQNQTGAPR